MVEETKAGRIPRIRARPLACTARRHEVEESPDYYDGTVETITRSGHYCLLPSCNRNVTLPPHQSNYTELSQRHDAPPLWFARTTTLCRVSRNKEFSVQATRGFVQRQSHIKVAAATIPLICKRDHDEVMIADRDWRPGQATEKLKNGRRDEGRSNCTPVAKVALGSGRGARRNLLKYPARWPNDIGLSSP